jgi:hypothetical protein
MRRQAARQGWTSRSPNSCTPWPRSRTPCCSSHRQATAAAPRLHADRTPPSSSARLSCAAPAPTSPPLGHTPRSPQISRLPAQTP